MNELTRTREHLSVLFNASLGLYQLISTEPSGPIEVAGIILLNY